MNDGDPVRCVVDVDGVPMSGLLAEAPDPRAVILAIHGGGTTSAYFDCPVRPRSSLLRTGAAAGFTVLALDRPGYGSSAGHPDAMARPAQRVDLAYGAVERILGSRSRGAGLFVFAHSMGCELALRMAVDARGADLLGIELAGTGLEHQAGARKVLALPNLADVRRGLRDLLWRDSHLYPPEIVGGDLISSGGAPYEGIVMKTWSTHDFPVLAARVRAPVQFSHADHECVWRSDPAALADIAAMFVAARRVRLNEQADSGHNISLGLAAAAYHVKVLSFIEECIYECVLARERGSGAVDASGEIELEAG